MYAFFGSALNYILLFTVLAFVAYIGRKVYRKFYPKK